jgi:hypothetical protein
MKPSSPQINRGSNGVPPLSPSPAISRNIAAWAAINSRTPTAMPSMPCSPLPYNFRRLLAWLRLLLLTILIA